MDLVVSKEGEVAGNVAKESMIELMNECIAEDIEAIREVFEEDIQPLIDYRVKMEKKIFNKAKEELDELEKELP